MLVLVLALLLASIVALTFGSLVALFVGRKNIQEWAGSGHGLDMGVTGLLLGWVGIGLVIFNTLLFVGLTLELGQIFGR